MILVLAFFLGVLSGLRSLMPITMVSAWARFGMLKVQGTPFAFLASPICTYSLVVLALGELVADKLPKTPSRKAAMGFGARIVTGGLCGGAVGATNDALVMGLVAGVVGAVVGTFGGSAFRARLADALKKDAPAALIEDVMTIVGTFVVLKLFV